MKRTHMADLPPYRVSSEDTGVRPGTPRWVKVFGIIVIVLVLLVGIVMVTRLGGEHGPGRHIPGSDAQPSSGPESTGGVSGPAAPSASARTVEVITLDTMNFEPNRINVSAGEMVTSSGQAVHEFTLGNAAMQQQHADEMARKADGMTHNEPNSISLQPRETRQLIWRFGDSGILEYACHEPGHYQAGRRGQLTITLMQAPTEVQRL
jgi:uncharacterized cupredoxin-like copper-binding protein